MALGVATLRGWHDGEHQHDLVHMHMHMRTTVHVLGGRTYAYVRCMPYACTCSCTSTYKHVQARTSTYEAGRNHDDYDEHSMTDD